MSVNYSIEQSYFWNFIHVSSSFPAQWGDTDHAGHLTAVHRPPLGDRWIAV